MTDLRSEALDRGQVDAWMKELMRHMPRDAAEELLEYWQYALLGICVGFSDRELSPFVEEHVVMIPPMLEEIRSVFLKIKASGTAYSKEEFVFRAYDYGIHKAYYLDWDLYGSKELY